MKSRIYTGLILSVSFLTFIFKKFKRNRSGATAVEFAIVALPFLSLLFAIIEVALVFFGSLALDNAVDKTSRLIRTGQAQGASMTEAQFKDDICQQIISLFNCTNSLRTELVTFTNFQAASDFVADASNNPLDGNGDLRDDFTYDDSSEAEEIVLVRVFFEWQLMPNFPGIGLANMGNGNRLVSTVAVFKNEPFN